MYYTDKNRNPDDYYYLLRKAFPDVCAVQSLGPGEFGACFEIFAELHMKREDEVPVDDGDDD